MEKEPQAGPDSRVRCRWARESALWIVLLLSLSPTLYGMVEHWLEVAEYYVAMGVDGILFADDWGTQT